MTKVTAKLSRLDMSPKKVRLVIDAVRGKKAAVAKRQLAFLNKKAAEPVLKLLNSAIANATHNHSLKEDTLEISEIRVDGGRTLKRWRPRAFGRAGKIRKRTSHIKIVLSGDVDPALVAKKEEKTAPADQAKVEAKIEKDADVVETKKEDTRE